MAVEHPSSSQETLSNTYGLSRAAGLPPGGPDEQYKPPAVARYRAALRTGSAPPVEEDSTGKHYSQLAYDWQDGAVVSRLFEGVGVPTTDQTIGVIGGFTGEYSHALTQAGGTVIFTDPLDEWVTNARAIGYEAYNYTASSLPGHLLVRCDAVTSFECYHLLSDASTSVYTLLRFALTPHGLIFIESERTRSALGGGDTPVEAAFNTLTSIFPLNVSEAATDGLRAYRLTPLDDAASTRYTRSAAHVLSELYQRGTRGITIPVTDGTLDDLRVATGVPVDVITDVLVDTVDAYRGLSPAGIQNAVPTQSFCLGRKGYYAPVWSFRG